MSNSQIKMQLSVRLYCLKVQFKSRLLFCNELESNQMIFCTLIKVSRPESWWHHEYLKSHTHEVFSAETHPACWLNSDTNLAFNDCKFMKIHHASPALSRIYIHTSFVGRKGRWHVLFAFLWLKQVQVELYCHSATCGDIQWNEMSCLTGPRCYINTDIQQYKPIHN